MPAIDRGYSRRWICCCAFSLMLFLPGSSGKALRPGNSCGTLDQAAPGGQQTIAHRLPNPVRTAGNDPIVAQPVNPKKRYPQDQSTLSKKLVHPPFSSHRRRMQPEPATLPGANQRPIWKTPFSYGYFGASGTRHWSLHHGYRDRYTEWRLQ